MSTATQTVSGAHYLELMKDVPDETRKQFEDGLVFFANDADASGMAEKNRADKLRTAYNILVEFLVSNRLNDLNVEQRVFLCTGAIDDNITILFNNAPKSFSLLPPEFYSLLLKTFSGPATLPFPIFGTMDKFTAIAQGDLLPLTVGDDRKKDLRNSPQDQKRAKEEYKRQIGQLKSEMNMSITQMDIHFPKFLNALSETSIKNAKIGLEMMKKVGLGWSKGEAATPQEKAIIKAFEGKLGEAGASMAKWVEEMGSTLSKVAEHSRLVEEKHQGMVRAINEIAKIDTGAPAVVKADGPLFDSDTISSIKRDIDNSNGVSVRTADSSPIKVAFSTSRILLAKQFSEGENFQDRLCSPANVSAALNKIMAIHTNLFPKDFEGKPIVPPILIEPLRNFVDFFQDRFIMGLVSGETARRGAHAVFTPTDVQVLRMCGLFLTKDPIYDYHGDVKVGTFMGDYVGKMEKSTKVKWTGSDKKFTLATTQSMEDTASREDAVNDYIDFITAMANNTAPSPKVSKRKISILLRYIMFDNLEKNIACLLKLVAQTDPTDAKETLMIFAKDDADRAKDMIKAAVAVDPQASKMFSDNPDFAIQRVFGR
ncbi:MAG: hypothetical protein ACREL1_06490 [bacterium]